MATKTLKYSNSDSVLGYTSCTRDSNMGVMDKKGSEGRREKWTMVVLREEFGMTHLRRWRQGGLRVILSYDAFWYLYQIQHCFPCPVWLCYELLLKMAIIQSEQWRCWLDEVRTTWWQSSFRFWKSYSWQLGWEGVSELQSKRVTISRAENHFPGIGRVFPITCSL